MSIFWPFRLFFSISPILETTKWALMYGKPQMSETFSRKISYNTGIGAHHTCRLFRRHWRGSETVYYFVQVQHTNVLKSVNHNVLGNFQIVFLEKWLFVTYTFYTRNHWYLVSIVWTLVWCPKIIDYLLSASGPYYFFPFIYRLVFAVHKIIRLLSADMAREISDAYQKY